MKRYQKPLCRIDSICMNKETASLSAWLLDNGLEQAGITTYEVQS